MKTTYKPVGNRILIKKTQIEETTKSGIIIPIDKEKEQVQNTKAEVLAIGYKVDKELGLKVGDIIVFAKYADSIIDNEEQISTVKDTDIQAILYKENHNENTK